MPQNAKKKFSGLSSIAILRKSSSHMTSYQDTRFVCVLLRFNKKSFNPFMFWEPISMFIVMPMCYCAIVF